MLSEYKNLVYGISEKKDGTMKFLNNMDDAAVKLNREKFFAKQNIKLDQIISAGLVYKNRVKIVDKNDAGKFISGFDALITNEDNLYLTITVADCLPIYIYDFKKKIIGIAHAGWQGVQQNIIKNAINLMKENFNSNSSDIFVYIGMHLQKCHFEVKDDLLLKFKKYKNAIIKKNNKIFIDLSLIVKTQLLEQGILEKNISVSDECTFCLKDRYFSYRRDKPKNIKAMIAYIGINN
ncbi:peptidoglycan editing factor PgeF [Candidatus Parcubacteria bacterium]|nr:peptidoglycan editing factor PgeF [Candidatus Parcubacteria bacterium]